MEERAQGGTISTSPGPHLGYGQQTATNGDKILMPPPDPPSGTAIKRQSPSLSPQPGPERKKSKVSQEEEEEEIEVPSSLASQVKEFKKYSYNQYSSNAQLYQSQEPNSQTFEQVSVQPAPPSVVPEQNAGIQPPQVHMVPGSQPPAPPPAAEQPLMTGYQTENGTQYIQYQTYSQFQPVQQTNTPSVYIGKFIVSLSHYHTVPHFDALKIYSCNKQLLLFSQCFLPYMALIFHFRCTLKCCLQFVSMGPV